MNTTGLDTRKIKLCVQIKKITMNIKFPCSLVLQLKHDNYFDSTKSHELKGGECIISETLQSQLEIFYNSSKIRYEDKKINMNVFMVSMSGKVASGSVAFSLYGKQSGATSECVQFLDKCPDKQAKIYYSFRFDVIKCSDRFDKSYYSSNQQHKKKGNHLSTYIPNTINTLKNNDREAIKSHRNASPIHLTTDALKQSFVEGVIALDKKGTRFENKDVLLSKRFSNQDTLRMKTYQNETPKGRPKINQNRSNRSFDIQSYTPIQRYKTQAQEGDRQQQLEKLKIKLRNLQKIDKSNSQTIRQTKEEAQRRRNKIHQLETTKFQLEELLRTKENKIKNLQKSLKQITEEKDQIQNQLKNIRTQADLRESTYKEQIRKLGEKYRQSQFERQNITEQYNKSLKAFEEGEKKYQLLIKQKEKATIEEKSRLNKKIDYQIVVQNESDKQLANLKMILQQLTIEKKELFDKLSNNEILLDDAKDINANLTLKLKSQTDKVKQLEQEIEIFKKSQLEKQQLKKKFNENTLTAATLSEKLDKKEKLQQSIEKKLSQQDMELQKKNNERNHLISKLSQLQKSYDNMKLHELQKQRQLQSLSSMNAAANVKIADLKAKLESEKQYMEQSQRQFGNKYNWLIKERDSLQAEAEQLRWQLQKQSNSLQDLSTQIRNQNQQIFHLSYDILDRNQKIKKLEQSLKQISSSYDHLVNTNKDNETKKKQNYIHLKASEQQNNQLRKKIERNQRQILDYKERIRIIEQTHREKINQAERKIKQKDDIIQSKFNQFHNIQSQLKDNQDEQVIIQQSLQVAQLEINHLRQTIIANRRDLQNQQAIIIKLKQNDIVRQNIIAQKDQQLSSQKEELDKVYKRGEKQIEEMLKYKQNCISSLSYFLSDLLKQEDTPSTSQVLRNRQGMYPQEQIASLQIEYIQKHWEKSSKQRIKISQLVQQKDILQYQLSRIKANLEQVQLKNETDLFNQRQKIRQLNEKLLKKNQQHKEVVQKYQQQLSQKQKQVQKIRANLLDEVEKKSQLQSQIQVMIRQYESIKQESHQLEQKLLSYRSRQIKEKAQWEGRQKQNADMFEDQMYHLKIVTRELQQKIHHLQKDLVDKNQAIKKLQVDQNVIVYERNKKQNQIDNLSTIIQQQNQNFKILEKDMKDKEKQLKKAHQTIQQWNSKYRQEVDKLEEAQFKIQEQNHLILDLNRDIERWKQQFRSQQVKNSELQDHTKHRLDALRIQNEKLNQELKQLKQKNISLSSELELTKFMVNQLQVANRCYKDTNNELINQQDKKKQQILQLTQQVARLSLLKQQMEQKLTVADEEKQTLIIGVERLKQTITILKNNNQDDKSSVQVSLLEKELEKVKNEKNQHEQYYERIIQQLKNNLRQVKRTQNNKLWRQQDLKKKLKNVERILGDTHPDLAAERSRFMKEADRQKRDMMMRNDQLQARLGQVQDQLNTLKQKTRKEEQFHIRYIAQIKEQLTAKEFFMRNQQAEINNLTFKINQISSDKSRLEVKMQQEKAKIKKIETQLQNQQKNNINRITKTKEDELKKVVGQLERKVESSKRRRLQGNFNEVERLMVTGIYGEFEEMMSSLSRERRI